MFVIKKTQAKQLILAAFLATLAFVVYNILKPKDDLGIQSGNQTQIRPKYNKKVLRSENRTQTTRDTKQPKISAISKEKTARAAEQVKRAQKEIELAMVEEAVKKDFKRKAYLDIRLPDGFKYRKINVDTGEDFILHGEGEDGKSEFTVIASERTPNKVELMELLQDGIPEVPTIGASGLKSILQIDKGKGAGDSGISEFTLFSAKNSIGNPTYVVLAPRSDKKGTYMFVLSADEKYIEENGDYFEQLKYKIKALSP